MKNFFLIATMILVAGCATAPAQTTSPSHEESLKNDTAGAILVGIDGDPQAIIFVSKTGKVYATSAKNCASNKSCIELVEKLNAEGKTESLILHNTEPQGTQTRLTKSASWDQENLKRDDHGCPTAIYVAPSGELKQCP
jgi:hypothetical protein